MAVLHELRILGLDGDTTMTFDPTDEVAVAEVKAEFDRLVGGLKMSAETVVDGDVEITREFDKTSPVTIVRRQMVGG